MRFVFFGSSEFAKIVLEKLLQSEMKPVLVVTNPPRPKGRKKIVSPTPVYNLAKQNDILVLAPENLKDAKFIAEFKNLKPEFVILTAYGKIIPSELLMIPPKGFINLHPSLLPRWRGATPIQSAILAGDDKTGVTLFLMDEEIDHGPIIQNTEYRIQNTRITYSELLKELAELGANLIIKAVPRWLKGEIKTMPQNHSLASYCHKITKEDEKIDWNKSSIEIDRKVRAFNPQPGVFTKAQRQKNEEIILKIIKGYPEKNDKSLEESQSSPGKVFDLEGKMAVKCGQGFYVIKQIKPAGKQTMPSEDFLRGNNWILNQILK